ncbi:hypothetical protein P7K49_012630 [Saguinus oedipus]|uniref:Uncharacterized protein n=1 Tax=Saguinus oedipus TaxID=9490 RepID=A0ABQ9VDM4_SAGOE|nr:hypothetical protein P7K49_012630 [Saguinus oedipus]
MCAYPEEINCTVSSLVSGAPGNQVYLQLFLSFVDLEGSTLFLEDSTRPSEHIHLQTYIVRKFLKNERLKIILIEADKIRRCRGLAAIGTNSHCHRFALTTDALFLSPSSMDLHLAGL